MESGSNSIAEKKSPFYRQLLTSMWIVPIAFAIGIGLMVYSDLFSIRWLIGLAVAIIFFIWSFPLMYRYIVFKLSIGTPAEIMRYEKHLKIGAIIPPIIGAIFIGIALFRSDPGQEYIFLFAFEFVTVIYALFTFVIFSKHKKKKYS